MVSEKVVNLVEQSPLKEAYILLGATTPLALSQKYTDEDQQLMKSHSWDYNNPDLIVNRVKELLEKVNPDSLSQEEKDWWNEILWFWHHHAISCAIGKYRDFEKAKEYSKKALYYKSFDKNHPNKITDIFDLLLNSKLQEAQALAQNLVDGKETALSLIEYYKNNWEHF